MTITPVLPTLFLIVFIFIIGFIAGHSIGYWKGFDNGAKGMFFYLEELGFLKKNKKKK